MKKISFITFLCFLSALAYVLGNEPDSEQYNFTIRHHTAAEAFNYIVYLSNKLSWFQNNGYTIDLPEHQALNNFYSKNGNANEAEIAHIQYIFETEIYNADDFLPGLQILETYRSTISQIISRLHALHKQWGFGLMPSYQVVLTLYGPGGSYWINKDVGYLIIKTDKRGFFKRPVSHAITHLMVQIAIQKNIVEKYRLTHWEKIRLADLICWTYFKDFVPNFNLQLCGDKAIGECITADAINTNPRVLGVCSIETLKL